MATEAEISEAYRAYLDAQNAASAYAAEHAPPPVGKLSAGVEIEPMSMSREVLTEHSRLVDEARARWDDFVRLYGERDGAGN